MVAPASCGKSPYSLFIHFPFRIRRASVFLAFVDVFTPMLDARGEPRPELFVQDMLHLNDAGYAIWTPRVAPWLK